MNVFYIQFMRLNSRNKHVWILFETNYPCIRTLSEALNSGDLVHGFELLTKPTEDPTTREVFDVIEKAFRLEEIKRIGLPTWKLVRYED